MKYCKRCKKEVPYMRYKNTCDSCYNTMKCQENGYKWQKAWRSRK